MRAAFEIAIGITMAWSVAEMQAFAEAEAPSLLPLARVSQQIGTTEIVVEYTSPAVRGRRIWGTLVPYDKPWVISPSRPTTIRFSEEVLVGGQTVAAGTYHLIAVPGRDKWTIELGAPATPTLDRAPRSDADTIRLKVPVRAAPPRERLAFVFSSFGDDGTSLDLEWDRVRVSIPIAAHAARRAELDMKALDDAWRSYANAARFMLETEKDFDAGLKYANQSLALRQDWYTYWIRASLHAAKRDYKRAAEDAQRASDLGQQQLGEGFVSKRELERNLIAWKKAIPAGGAAASE